MVSSGTVEGVGPCLAPHRCRRNPRLLSAATSVTKTAVRRNEGVRCNPVCPIRVGDVCPRRGQGGAAWVGTGGGATNRARQDVGRRDGVYPKRALLKRAVRTGAVISGPDEGPKKGRPGAEEAGGREAQHRPVGLVPPVGGTGDDGDGALLVSQETAIGQGRRKGLCGLTLGSEATV